MQDATASLLLVRDFVNTLEVESGTDSLTASQMVGRAELKEAAEVREALRELLRANNGLPAEVERASRVLDRAARRAGLSVRFQDGSARLRGRRGLGTIVAAAADAMRSPDWPRLKACRAADCHWAFLDGAKNRSRAWCDMKVCGNREKAHRYRARHAGG
jgi:predicted RNA-binding Zn ribbon-like protein